MSPSPVYLLKYRGFGVQPITHSSGTTTVNNSCRRKSQRRPYMGFSSLLHSCIPCTGKISHRQSRQPSRRFRRNCLSSYYLTAFMSPSRRRFAKYIQGLSWAWAGRSLINLSLVQWIICMSNLCGPTSKTEGSMPGKHIYDINGKLTGDKEDSSEDSLHYLYFVCVPLTYLDE